MIKSSIENFQPEQKLNNEQKVQDKQVSPSSANAMLSEVFPKTKECHCGEIADKYTSRQFINVAGYKVFRIFYRCRNCWSRIHEDFIPELDNKKKVDVFELLSNFR